MTTGFTCYRCASTYGVWLKAHPEAGARAERFKACSEKRCLPIRWILLDHAKWLERHGGPEMDLVIEALQAGELRFRETHPGWQIADAEDGR